MDVSAAGTAKAMRIVLAADGSAGLKVARKVAGTGHVLSAVAAPATDANRPLLDIARDGGAEIFAGSIVRDPDFADWMRDHSIDALLSVHTSYIMHEDVLNAAPVGAFNLHPGPLPSYAGRNPVSWAIFNGETTHAATLHQMVPRIDAGPIVADRTVPIEPGDTALTLMARTSTAGVQLVSELLATLAAGDPVALREQPTEGRAYYSNRDVPMNGTIDWTRPAREVLAFVRASDFGPFPSPWGKPRFELDGPRLLLAAEPGERTDAAPGTVGRAADGTTRIAAADRWVVLTKHEPG